MEEFLSRWRIERPRDRSRVAKRADARARRLRENEESQGKRVRPIALKVDLPHRLEYPQPISFLQERRVS